MEMLQVERAKAAIRSADRQAAQQSARPCHQHRRERCAYQPFEGSTRVRMRIDGTIVDYVTLQRSVHQPLIARIKVMANLDIAERRLRRTVISVSVWDKSEYVNIVYRCCRPCSEKGGAANSGSGGSGRSRQPLRHVDDESYAGVPAC